MKKTVLVVGFLLFVALIGSKAFVALFGYQSMEKYQDVARHEAAISYSWLSSELGGVLVIHDLVVTPYRLKRTIHIDRLRLYFEDYPRMLLGLLALKDGDWQSLKRIRFQGARAELEGRDLEEWLAMEFGREFSVPFGLYGCGDHARVDHQVLQNMGIESLHADLDLALDKGDGADRFSFSMGMNLHELGKLESHASLNLSTQEFSSLDALLNDLAIHSLQVTHVESGYFRRLSNYCGDLENQDRDMFAASSARRWQLAMSRNGLLPGNGFVSLYEDYLRLGGTMTLSMQTESALGLSDTVNLLGDNLVESLNIRASLNGQPVTLNTLIVDATYFQARNADPEPQKKVEPLPVKEAPRIKRFEETSVEAVDLYQGYRVRVTSLEGKTITGTLESIGEFAISVAQPVQGGQVSYQVRRDQIRLLEVWR